ncbi:YbjN domain-containing protein [Brevundimonas lenta]|uniref:YbjN domain-containing protein n=1 Tax=Brevundimonas lenta TaxID=424796 RepID=A0A7W6JFC3_9CAUL|nr:YbjN domain-containing protein [Brevundimonas lenta]MBB4084051.1 hypothetical protein [Brevundimonas lenta]
MRKSSVAAICAALAIGLPVAATTTPAAAQEARVGQAQIYRSLLQSDLASLLNDMGFATVKKAQGGRFDIETTDGFKYSVELMICDLEDQPPGCLGVSIFATWGVNAGDETKLRGAIDNFNNEYRIGKALMLENSIYAERYVTTDGGVTLQHIREEIGEFEAAMFQFNEMMNQSLGA